MVTRNMYDAETDLGIVAGRPDVAEANSKRFTAALQAMWSGGRYPFISGSVGPVLRPIAFSGKQFFFKQTVKSSARNGGGKIYGAGCGYFLPEYAYGNDNAGGSVTRLTWLDSPGPALRLRGTNLQMEGCEIQGRRWITGDYAAGIPLRETLVEVEGRTYPATGLHRFVNCTFDGAFNAFRTLPGYYDDSNGWVQDEAHADQSLVDGCHFYNVGNVNRSENQQSIGWKFENCTYNQHWSGDFPDAAMVVHNIARGGHVTDDRGMLNHNRSVLFKVRDYSHNTQTLTATNFQWDNFNNPTDYLTLFQYDGPIDPNGMKGYQWSVRVQGGIGNCYPDPYDKSKLIVISQAARDLGFPFDDLMFDMARLPSANFNRLANWWVPK